MKLCVCVCACYWVLSNLTALQLLFVELMSCQCVWNSLIRFFQKNNNGKESDWMCIRHLNEVGIAGGCRSPHRAEIIQPVGPMLGEVVKAALRRVGKIYWAADWEVNSVGVLSSHCALFHFMCKPRPRKCWTKCSEGGIGAGWAAGREKEMDVIISNATNSFKLHLASVPPRRPSWRRDESTQVLNNLVIIIISSIIIIIFLFVFFRLGLQLHFSCVCLIFFFIIFC